MIPLYYVNNIPDEAYLATMLLFALLWTGYFTWKIIESMIFQRKLTKYIRDLDRQIEEMKGRQDD